MKWIFIIFYPIFLAMNSTFPIFIFFNADKLIMINQFGIKCVKNEVKKVLNLHVFQEMKDIFFINLSDAATLME